MKQQYNEQHRLRTCLWIINLLQRHGELTLREINEHWLKTELSNGLEIIPRTFFNYRSAILDLFSIVIECKKSTNSYHIAYVEDNLTSEWILSSLSVSQILQENKDLSSRILLESIPSGQKHLNSIIEAMHNCTKIEISYQRFVEDKPHKVEVEPYCAKLFHQRWYVVANNIKRGHLQTYALDRIKDIKVLGSKFEIDPNFDAKEFFQNSFGIFAAENQRPQRIVLKVDSTQSKYFRTLPLHHSQVELSVDDDHSIFVYSLVPTEDFIIELMSHGSSIEVLEPKSLRNTMKENATKLFKLYENDKK